MPQNVAKLVDPPLPEPHEIRPLSSEQARRLLKVAHGTCFGVLTTTGADYLDEPTDVALIVIARANVAGFDEILDALEKHPMTATDLLDDLRERLGVSWVTDAQAQFRLGWLENLVAVSEHGGAWSLVSR